MGFEVEDVRSEVDRILRSRTFETSEAHRRLLDYLATKALSGEADRLKEYTVGIEAFGKPHTYDPRHDSIVRLQVSRLRQKLQTYYQTEAPDSQIRVGLPKGAFKLSFEESNHRNGGSSEPSWLNARWIPWSALALAVIWATLATAGYVSARREAEPASRMWTPELEALWAPFLESHRSLLVCLGTPLFVRVPEYGFFRDPRSNEWQNIEKSDRVAALKKNLGARDLLPSYAFTGAGEASGGFLLAKLLATRKPDVLLTRSSILSWQQVSDHDVVFLGPPKFNLQLASAAMAQDIVIEADGIRNLRPRPGEPVFLEDHLAPGRTQEGETHALISRTPGLTGVGDLLVIGGNASSDTFAAAEWLTQPARAKLLVARLQDSSGRIPRYFQAVIKVSFKQGIPLQSSYVFHHVVAADAGPTPASK